MKKVYLVDGVRTPYLKVRTQRGAFSASDLAVASGRALLLRQPITPDKIDEVILGCIMPSQDEANIARIVALRMGCGDKVPAWTVQRNCASGMQAIDAAMQSINQGRSGLVFAGGTEAMSHAPLIVNEALTNWFMRWSSARKLTDKLVLLTQLRPSHLRFIIALLRGLNDPVIGLSMGQTAENVAERFHITRTMMDEFAVTSNQRIAAAYDDGVMDEVIPIIDGAGNVYAQDDGLRRDSSVEKLAKLKPVFDRKFGRVTAGNSSQITDGSASVLLANEATIKKHNLNVLARIVDVEWAGMDPANMGLGPVHAATQLMQRHHLTLDDIDFWEINEAFAAQVLGCVAAWKDEEYCKTHLGLSKAFGELDMAKVNIDGGAIAIGHPVGSSGARIVLHLAEILRRRSATRGIATICIGGGQGGAVLIERVDGVE